MTLITWTDDFSVGVDSIDAQHKKLVSMINTLNDALEDGSADDVTHDIFDALAAYTIIHFNYEEKLFNQYGYEESDNHKAEHKALKEQVVELQKKMDDGDFMISIELLSFLKNWLTNHILKADMAYSQFLIAKGVK